MIFNPVKVLKMLLPPCHLFTEHSSSTARQYQADNGLPNAFQESQTPARGVSFQTIPRMECGLRNPCPQLWPYGQENGDPVQMLFLYIIHRWNASPD